MPGYRNYRKRNYRRRRNYRGKRRSGGSTALRIAKGAWRLAKYAVPELHFLDTVFSLNDLGSVASDVNDSDLFNTIDDVTAQRSGAIHRIDTISQGDTSSTRDGDDVSKKQLYYRCRMVLDPAEGNRDSAMVRTVLVQDNEPDGSMPSLTNIFDTQGQNVPSTTNFLNMENKRRFRILKNSIRQLTNNGNESYQINWAVPLKGTRATYSGNNKIKSGAAHYIVHLVDRGNGAVDFEQDARLRFTS